MPPIGLLIFGHWFCLKKIYIYNSYIMVTLQNFIIYYLSYMTVMNKSETVRILKILETDGKE